MTRTNSPYFSPNRARTPASRADVSDVSYAYTGSSDMMMFIAKRSTSRICSWCMGSKCVKSKRSLSGATSDPACFTCSPRTSVNARCQDVRRRVVARDEGAAACVDGGVHDIALVNAPGDDRAVMDGQALLGPFGVIDGDGAQVVRYGAGVAHLAAHLAVERRLVEYDGDLLAFMGLVDDRAVDDDVDDARVAFVLLVTHELGGAMHVEDVREDVAEAVPGLVIASCACPFAAWAVISVFEALHVDLDALARWQISAVSSTGNPYVSVPG